MEEVETLKAERAVIESELKGTNPDMKTVFLQAAANGNLNEPLISAQSLGKAFGPFQQQVSESITKQERIIAETQDLYQPFIQERGGSGGAREEALKSIASAYDAFMELKGNLQEGTKFYNDLTQLLVTFQSKVSDFCFARKTEKEELLKDLSSSLSSMSLEPPPQAPAHHAQDPTRPARKNDPPARPPPPAVGAPAPAAPPETSSAAPPAQAPTAAAPNPYAGAPGPLPYPAQPTMPMPYQPYTPMPGGYNPYAVYQNPPAAMPQQGYPQQGYYQPQYGAPPPQGYPPNPNPNPYAQQPGYPQQPQQQQPGYPQQQPGYPPAPGYPQQPQWR